MLRRPDRCAEGGGTVGAVRFIIAVMIMVICAVVTNYHPSADIAYLVLAILLAGDLAQKV